ncbi:MAG: alpha/beta fold hydrolase [Promethearchaeota archaeon]|nr:MAG: alpha/beta fold hydrolase [Candidatus Lokiarchaeota archaeon]
MLSKNQKRILVIIASFLVSAFIWQINASWGNTFRILLIASILTFLTVYAPFEIYFTFRDIWFDRWDILELKNLEIQKLRIPVNSELIHADLIRSKDNEAVKSKNTLIIVSGGFSDKKETLQYYYFPLAYQGYVILAYDARGIGESKNAGHRADFLKRIEDFNKIIEWIENSEDLKDFKIYALGISIGAITVLCAGFPKDNIEKIVAVSSMSHYRKSISAANIIVKFSYFMKGVNISPDEEVNQKFSPYMVIERLKNILSQAEWEDFSQKVLLIHSKNDKIIPFINFEENKSILELSDEKQLILKKGGHMQKKNELALVGATLNFFNS